MSDIEKSSAHEHDQIVIGQNLVIEKVHDVSQVKDAKVENVHNGKSLCSTIEHGVDASIPSCLHCCREAIEPLPLESRVSLPFLGHVHLVLVFLCQRI